VTCLFQECWAPSRLTALALAPGPFLLVDPATNQRPAMRRLEAAQPGDMVLPLLPSLVLRPASPATAKIVMSTVCMADITKHARNSDGIARSIIANRRFPLQRSPPNAPYHCR